MVVENARTRLQRDLKWPSIICIHKSLYTARKNPLSRNTREGRILRHSFWEGRNETFVHRSKLVERIFPRVSVGRAFRIFE